MIRWNVDPVIVEVGSFSLRYYSLMFVMGFILMGEYVSKRFKHYGKDPVLVSSLTTHIIIGMLLGSRLAHCFFYEPQYYLANPLDILKIWEGGLASHGGYLGVIIAVWIFLKKHRDLKFFWVLDIIAGPCLFVGGLIRLGNLFNSEIVGVPTDLPWAFVFERVDLFPRHPAQIYESIGYFTISFILFAMERKKLNVWKNGAIISYAIIISFIFRFIIEFVKAEQSTLTIFNFLNMGQLLSIGFGLFGFILLSFINRRTARSS
jgi:phosphatidylglycerol:prolipoprotein diacylglycerol transferase